VRWLIDGYNVIRRDAELAGIDRRSLEEGRDALLRLLARVARDSPDEFVVVFDGVRSTAVSPNAGRVQVVFSRSPEKADDVLVRLARQGGAGATVVTSDRSVQAAANRVHAAVVGAEAFLDRVSAPPADAEDRDDDTPDRPKPKKGNPRRRSREDRRSQSALDRLRTRRP